MKRVAEGVYFGAYGLAWLLWIAAFAAFGFELASFVSGSAAGDEFKASVYFLGLFLILPALILWFVGRTAFYIWTGY